MKKSFQKIISSFKRAKNGVCSICDGLFPDEGLEIGDELSLCGNCLNFYNHNQWLLVKTVNSDPDNPEAALKLQLQKDKLKKINIPSYIQTEYFEHNDQLISQFQLYIAKPYLEQFNSIE